MVTMNKIGRDFYSAGGVLKALVEVYCLEDDTKPTDGVANGSIAIEVDTGKVYFYDEDGEAWIEQFSFQS